MLLLVALLSENALLKCKQVGDEAISMGRQSFQKVVAMPTLSTTDSSINLAFTKP